MRTFGRRAVDAVVCLVVLVLSAVVHGGPFAQAPVIFPLPNQLTIALAVVQVVALWFRRSAPRQVWAVTIAVVLLAVGIYGFTGGAAVSPSRLLFAVVPATYSAAAYVSRRWALIAGAGGAGLAVLTLLASTAAGLSDPGLYAVVAWILGAAALGDAVRSNRELIASSRERAQRAEATREAEAARRVAEERLRISRELHDVIAHQLAAVSVHAGVAEHLVSTDPARAATALAQVRESAATALREMRSMVGLLRTETDGAVESSAPPRLAQLPQLVKALGEETEGRGRAIRWDRTGPEPSLEASAELHVYRIVQESLTNALKHGVGPIELVSGPSERGFTLRVRNSTRPGVAAGLGEGGGGYGLISMRERADAIGARLQAGRDGDSAYLVELVLK